MIRLLLVILLFTLTACEDFSLVEAQKHYHNEDYQSAAVELQRLAERGNPEGQYALGYLYYYGLGVPESNVMAKYWIGKAAEAGKPEAVEALNLLQADRLAARTAPLNHYPSPPPDDAIILPAPSLNGYMGKYSSKGRKKISTQNPPGVAVVSVAEECAPIMSDNTYRIELFSSDSLVAAQQFMKLQEVDLATQCYCIESNNKPGYIVTYGRYWTRSDAEQALQQLPPSARELRPSVISFN